ncbi:MAG TPA: hypothetical protein VG389_10540 [Myxococcota bacterium]|jgi:hypothetical protein|nr:hypothetical protein [Myxococcota bacterium]
MRLLLGLLKGAVAGAAVGVGFHFLNEAHDWSWLPWVMYGLAGTLVGVVCGAPFWKFDNIFTTGLKALVGFGVGVGLYAVGRLDAVNASLPFAFLGEGDTEAGAHLVNEYPIFGAAIGLLWGFLLELDESVGGDKKDAGGGATAAAKPAPKT